MEDAAQRAPRPHELLESSLLDKAAVLDDERPVRGLDGPQAVRREGGPGFRKDKLVPLRDSSRMRATGRVDGQRAAIWIADYILDVRDESGAARRLTDSRGSVFSRVTLTTETDGVLRQREEEMFESIAPCPDRGVV